MDRQVEKVTGAAPFLGLLEFLQIASFHHRDLTLQLETPLAEGHIVLADGHVTDAVMGSARGVGALFPLIQAGMEGTFSLLPPPREFPQQSITLSMSQVLMRVATMMPDISPPNHNTSWRIEGTTTNLLSVEEILQIFENSKKPAILQVGHTQESIITITLGDGGVTKAEGPKGNGPEAVYQALRLKDAPFILLSPDSPPAVRKMHEVAALVMEGLRRRNEDELVQSELNVEQNIHAREALECLEEGQLDETMRLQIARRYLPGGEIAPAWIVARLTVDDCISVREAALETLGDMPEPVLEALANDPETPRPLLTYLLTQFGSDDVSAAVILNPQVSEEALLDFAPHAQGRSLEAYRAKTDLLRTNRALRNQLRSNGHCHFGDLLDQMEQEAAPRMRKRSFLSSFSEKEQQELVLIKPEVDARKEKPQNKPGPKDIQYLAKRGSLRQKMDLVCGNDDDIAVEIVSAPGLPETFISSVAESSSANAAALRHIAGDRTFRRNVSIITALLFNPKTPVPSSLGLLPMARPDALQKLAGSRDVPDGTRQGARQMLEKRKKKPKK